MGQIKFVVGLIMASLFAVAIISYMTGYSNDNAVAVDFRDDADFSSAQTDLESDLSTFTLNVNSSSKALFESEITAEEETTRTGGQFKVNPTSAFGTLKTMVTLGFEKIFGKDTNFGVVLTAFTSVLVFIAGLYIWKTWKGGNPD